MADPIKVSFDEKALTSESAHQKTIMRWSAFQKVTVEKQHICVWYRESQAVVIPQSVFKSEEERDEAVAFINTQIAQSIQDGN